jgi:hypothetical protein
VTAVQLGYKPRMGADDVWPISNSEIQTWKDCRRKWFLGSYLGLRLKLRTTTGPLALGSRLHSALEAYYTEGADLLQAHAKLLDADRQSALLDLRDVTELENEGELGRIMLEGYLEWLEETGADADWEVVSAERVVSAPIMDGKVELRGKLDMRVRRLTDDVLLTVDHKSTANFSDLTRTAYIDEQLLMYHLLETLSPSGDGARCDGGVLNMLRKVKRSGSARPPFYDRLEIRHNKQMLHSFWFRIHGEIMDMLKLKAQLDAGVDHRVVAYPRPSRDCSWKCPFFAVCPLLDDGSAAEHMLNDLYVQSDPNERYNEQEKRLELATA